MDSTTQFQCFNMQTRKTLGLCLTILGLVLVVASLSAVFLHYSIPGSNGLAGIVGALILIIGLIILITEMLERLLSRSQSALVDGLQAG